MRKLCLSILVGFMLLILTGNTASAKTFEQIEQDNDTIVGVYGVNTANGKHIQHRSDERFAFASTYKAIASGILLQNTATSTLNKKIDIKKDDIVANSPVTEKYVGSQMTLKALIQASMLQSDNTANNKIINEIGGIKGFHEELKQLEDNISNPQRLEPELNLYDPTSTADTTTPKAAAMTLKHILTNEDMSKANRNLLKNVMIHNETGDTLIKAGVSKQAVVGDKSGQGLTYGTRNDLAFIYPKNQKEPIVLAIYTKKDGKDAKPNDKVIQMATKTAMEALK
ncbi:MULTISPECIES: class A beta-lactamase [Staphylococcus]|uniref:Beta-lactamase n=1 Tax=Staphylococcus nepalensis TaxID=214473 RepID=A0A291JNQ7_9STAP|nr:MULTISPECIES: class A beta-lactamase [Staphylococcus]ATH61017.1 BlaZ family class A beta-lactamase [Staphylococcus nepalensis]ATH66047.1 BlaZ family class A beta-lactamase [Staphylococcus nepalensis]AWI45438.1 BlaZ family class A beta-lactamase [Staphylococcus nepalensis]MBO1206396.1 class A beta-lactamase [Staphylococcus nepalensis]MBO1222062.1 class A beta-lactamase [Staphylococcus nepalensis]